MIPCTGGAPKELLPVPNPDGLPAIHHAVQLAVDGGATQVVLVLRQGKEDIQRYFETDALALAEAASLTCRFQPEPSGEGEAILQCKDLLTAGCFGVLYPDNIFVASPEGEGASPLSLLRKMATREGEEAVVDTLGLHRPEQHELAGYANSGRVDLGPHPACIPGLRLVLNMYAKGPGNFMPRRPGEARVCGMYVATQRFLQALEAAAATLTDGEELTDGHARRQMLAAGQPLQAVLLPGQVYEMGTPAGYELACGAMERTQAE